jgi:radical SAM protein with 4Fe4S-binding SPASM domain
MDYAKISELYLINFLKQSKNFLKLDNFLDALMEFKERSVFCKSYPVWLTMDPTNICTLKCPFCPTGWGNIKRAKGMMGLKHFEKIMDMLGPYLLHIDMQNWGEPLLHKDIYKMISYAKKFDINIALSTNFQNFDEKSAEDMVNSRLDRLLLSIDGASKDTYEKYRRGGNFLQAIENIKILVKKKKESKSFLPYINWQFLVFRHNEHEVEAAKKMAKELGVDAFGATSAFIAADSADFKGWIPLNKEYSRYDLADAPKTIMGSDSLLKQSEEAVCDWLWKGIAINWDGTVSPCCGVYLEEEDFGNILKEQDFKQFWNNDHYIIARKFMRDRHSQGEELKNTCVNCKKIGQINVALDRDLWINSTKKYLEWKYGLKDYDARLK